MVNGIKHNWVRVTRSEHCPVCDKPDYCTRSEDGTLVCCMRVESRQPSTNKLGGWIHRLSEPLPERKERREEPPKVEWEVEAQRMFKAGSYERKRLSAALGLQEFALEELMVGFGFDEYRKTTFASWPERNADGRVVGIVRRYADGSKKTMRGSHHGLYFGRQPTVMPGPVYLPEGGSDTAAMIGLGINAIGRPSNTGGIDYLGKILRRVEKVVVVVGERDRKQIEECSCGRCMRCWPGLAGAMLTADRLSAVLRRTVLVRMFPAAKDTREWVKSHDGASAIDAIDALSYDPIAEPCRVCGNDPPHERRKSRQLTQHICRKCRALLEQTR